MRGGGVIVDFGVVGAVGAGASRGSVQGTKAGHVANRGRGRSNPMRHDPQPFDHTDDAGDDEALLGQVADGAKQAFVALYRRRSDDVYRFAYAMAKSRSVAQDVTQEVFLNVLENAARFDARKGSVRAWLFGCARHVILDRLRLESRWTSELPEGAAEGATDCRNEEQLLAEQRIGWLHAAIAELPVEYREALVLCELQELSYAETAIVLDCPIGTVRSRLHRARALLAAALGPTEAGAAAARPLETSEVYP
jgi:RNA polymerase sigma-70 factor, ECF subfamily